MPKPILPLNKYLDKKLRLKIHPNRIVIGTLRGSDAFMNVVLEDALEEVNDTESNRIGTVVSYHGRNR